MQGQILQADSALKSGIILGDDGNRYAFSTSDWRAADLPAMGMKVDFVPGDGAAHEIFPLPGFAGAGFAGTAQPRPVAMQPVMPPPANTSGRTAPNSSVMLGTLAVACLVLGFIIPVLPTIAAFILGLIGADVAKRYKDSTGLVLSRIGWIGALVLTALVVILITWALAFAWPFFEVLWQMIMQDMAKQQGQTALLGLLR